MVKFPWSSDDSGDSHDDLDDGTGEPSGTDTGEPSGTDTGKPSGTETGDATGTGTGDATGTETDHDATDREGNGDRQGDADAVEPIPEGEAIVTCEFQDGTLRVFEDVLQIERRGRSKFSTKWIALNQVQGVIYERRLVINYLQIEQVDFQLSDEGLLSTPVDENTLHFGRGKRDCAQRATDEILDRMEQV